MRSGGRRGSQFPEEARRVERVGSMGAAGGVTSRAALGGWQSLCVSSGVACASRGPARGPHGAGGARKEAAAASWTRAASWPVISSKDFALWVCPSFGAEGSVFPQEPGIRIFLSEKS